MKHRLDLFRSSRQLNSSDDQHPQNHFASRHLQYHSAQLGSDLHLSNWKLKYCPFQDQSLVATNFTARTLQTRCVNSNFPIEQIFTQS